MRWEGTVATGYQEGNFRRESKRQVSAKIPRIAPVTGAKNIPGPSFTPEMRPSQSVRIWTYELETRTWSHAIVILRASHAETQPNTHAH
jgi:hypothetical protein